MFTSDNGSDAAFSIFDSNDGLPGYKGQLMEGGLRVPLIAHWPGRIQAGSTSESIFAFWDMMPTWVELAGINAPQPIDGISMVPALLRQTSDYVHDYLYWELDGQRYVVKVNDTRDDSSIIAEAHTEVVVPEWTPNVTAGCMDPNYAEYNVLATVHERSMCQNLTGINNVNPIENLVFSPVRNILSVTSENSYSLKIFATKGNLVYQKEGRGRQIFNIGIIKDTGIYILQLNFRESNQFIVKRIFKE
jgi:hypothetical protein